MTPLQRAARALYALDPETTDVFRRDCLRPNAPPPYTTRDTLWEELAEPVRQKHLLAARAVLEAIREPSEDMVKQGDKGLGICTTAVIWPMMIDAALAEETNA